MLISKQQNIYSFNDFALLKMEEKRNEEYT